MSATAQECGRGGGASQTLALRSWSDCSGKGGVVVAIQNELGISTRFIGTGEKLGDLAFFESRLFVEQML